MTEDASFAHFHRLEPLVRPGGSGGLLDEALRAEVCDPLFMMTRQWQLAEFHGEDGGSPVSAHVTIAGAPVNRFRPSDDGAPVPLEAGVPLEYLVEAGGPQQELPLRTAARAGLRFLSSLRALPTSILDRVTREAVAECPLGQPPQIEGVRDPDPTGRTLCEALATRAPHGAALARRLAAGWRPTGLTGEDARTFEEAADRWRQWFTAEHTPPIPSSSWVRDRLEHRFSVGASLEGEQIVLTAPEYTGGRAEGYHLDIDRREGRALGAPAVAGPPAERTTLPTRATYPGMPAERWWEFEDSTVNLPAIGAGPPDLARLLIVEFANVYGNDHWVIPVDLGIGMVHRITDFSVTDTFGDVLEIGPADDDAWSMFRPADTETGKPGPHLLPLLTAAADRIEGSPVEEVLFARDEMANLAWAVERVVQSATGAPRLRSGEVADDDPSPTAPAQGTLVYGLMTPVPAHWIPLVPVPLVPGSEAIRFRRGQIPRFTVDGTRRPQVRAAGQLLEPDTERVYIREEEIPRSGLTVTRTPVATRGRDGTVHCWAGRRVHVARGEASSGLAFDGVLTPSGGQR
ncbi:hypothetical protein OHB54_01925 [Streptomyces sp. NBC_01007]|nr:hypothetical protein OHB54_01925 [Streptomyces sp. NBC_01007]